MKKLLAVILSLFIVGGTLPMPEISSQIIAKAYDVDDYEVYSEGPLTYHIYPYVAEAYAEVVECSGTYKGELVIPERVNGIPVKRIEGTNGCYGNYDLTSVKLPDTLTWIAEGVFARTGLKEVKIPDSVSGIGRKAFYECPYLELITIPDRVGSIGEFAFGETPWMNAQQKKDPCVVVNGILINGQACTGDVNIPDGVERINESAFYYNSELESVTIPASVSEIRRDAFWECRGLKSITVLNPNCYFYDAPLTKDQYDPFSEDFRGIIYGLPDSTAHEYAQKYGYWFEYAPGYEPVTETTTTSTTTTTTATSILNTTISSETTEYTIVTSDRNTYYVYKDHAELVKGERNNIPVKVNGVILTRIGDEAFAHADFNTIIIPENIESIGYAAFFSCSNLKSVTIKNPDCEIYDSRRTFCNYTNPDSFNGTIYCAFDSTAIEYAKKYGYSYYPSGISDKTTTTSTTTTITTTNVQITSSTTENNVISSYNQVIEGEDLQGADLWTSLYDKDLYGYSGEGFWYLTASSASYEFYAPYEGDYQITVRGAQILNDNREQAYIVNGVKYFANAEYSDKWKDYDYGTVHMNKGKNTIEFIVEYGYIAIDTITISNTVYQENLTTTTSKTTATTTTTTTTTTTNTTTMPETSTTTEPGTTYASWQDAFNAVLKDNGGTERAYELYDINNDGIPEMFLSMGEYGYSTPCYIYAYVDKKPVHLMTGGSYGNAAVDLTHHYAILAWSHMGGIYERYVKFDGREASDVAEFYVSTNTSPEEYTVNGEIVDKEVYLAAHKTFEGIEIKSGIGRKHATTEPVSVFPEYPFKYSEKNGYIEINTFEYDVVDAVIPDKVNGKAVKYIAGTAFNYLSKLKSVTIPASVIDMGDSQFYYCESLERIDVNSYNSYYSSVNGVLFDKNKTALLRYPENKAGTSYTIPSTVKTISDYAFAKCQKLKSVSIPNSVTTIGKNAFYSFKNLTSITIPDSVTNIGSSAFDGCEGLKTVSLPQSVRYIDTNAFAYCKNLTSVTILNPSCTLYDNFGTISNGWRNSNYYFDGTICGNNNSTAQKYANKYGYKFKALVKTYPKNTRGFVTRMYNVALNREPDTAGLNNWVTKLNNHTATAADIINGFFFSDEYKGKNKSSEEMVIDCYKAMLDRSPDSTGKANWKKRLDVGMSIQAICNGFVGSSEFKSLCDSYGIKPGSINLRYAKDESYDRTYFIYRLYANCLGRTPDGTGLENWAKSLKNGKTGSSIAEGFIFSKEYKNKHVTNSDFVDMMYRTILGRNGDSNGINSWTSKLNYSNTREFVFNGFLFSTEFKNQCEKAGIKVGNKIATKDDTTAWKYNIAVLKEINNKRTSLGLKALTTRQDVWEDIAIVRAKELTKKYDTTNRPDGTTVKELFTSLFLGKNYYSKYSYDAFNGKSVSLFDAAEIRDQLFKYANQGSKLRGSEYSIFAIAYEDVSLIDNKHNYLYFDVLLELTKAVG